MARAEELSRVPATPRLAELSRAAAASDDGATQAYWRAVPARVLLERGELHQAQSLADAAVGLLTGTDAPNLRAGN